MVTPLGDTPRRWGPRIGGRDASDGDRQVVPVPAPFDDRELAQVEQCSASDVDLAVTSAHEAYVEHRRTPSHVRAAWLHDAADAVDAAATTLIDTLVHVLGKPRKMSEGEVRRGPDLLRGCAEELSRFEGRTLALDSAPNGVGMWGLTRREPYGVVGAITPFNAPVNLLLQKVAPALAVGNTTVVKPAPEGAITALQLSEVLDEVLPAGLVNVVTGGVETAQALVRHELVRAVSLTGGVAAGEAVLREAGIKPVLLELGSNSPNIVCADADIDDAATRIAGAAFGASGQQCISAQRIIVDRAVVEAFTERFVAAAEKLTIGDPDDPATVIGPLVSWRRKEHVDRFLADAEDRGGRLLLDGRRDDLLYGPTVVTDLPREALLRCDEVFGPVAVLVPVGSFDEAIVDANDSEFGLQASCFTRSLELAMRAAEEIEAGSVLINQPSRFRIDLYPFGGFKKSGIGREGIRSAMEELSQEKTVAIRGVL